MHMRGLRALELLDQAPLRSVRIFPKRHVRLVPRVVSFLGKLLLILPLLVKNGPRTNEPRVRVFLILRLRLYRRLRLRLGLKSRLIVVTHERLHALVQFARQSILFL